MEDDQQVDPDVQRAQDDELIRQYLLAEAREWAEYDRVYGFVRK